MKPETRQAIADLIEVSLAVSAAMANKGQIVRARQLRDNAHELLDALERDSEANTDQDGTDGHDKPAPVHE